MTADTLDRSTVARALARVLRQRFPVRAGDEAVTRVPLSARALERIAEDMAAAVGVEAEDFAVGLDLEVLISCCQEMVALIYSARVDDGDARWLRPLVDAAGEAEELLADLGRPLTPDIREALVL